MDYFKKMLGIREMLDDGFNHAIYGKHKGGYTLRIRNKAQIKADKRGQKKWVKNHELKQLRKDEDNYNL
jgi:hypothetical protein